MLNEPSFLVTGENVPVAERSSQPVPDKQREMYAPLDKAVAEVMDVFQTDYDPKPPASVKYVGRLRLDSETAYAQMDVQFKALDYHTVLTTDEQGNHVVMALKSRIQPKPRPWWPNALLLFLTLLSLLYTGAAHEAGMHDRTDIRLLQGLPYALGMLLILGTHELGHYFAARYHRVNVTLPYFIPAPVSFGTLGAFIQLREPMRNRKMLFDIGVAGPLAGLVIAVPVLIIGLTTSNVKPLPTTDYVLEGDSLLYAFTKLAIFGKLLPNGQEDVFINQLAKAGWTGLFVTGLNLIPLGQLDGGHVIFTLLGRRAQSLYMPIVLGFLVLSLYNPAWFLWLFLLFFLGRAYAVPLDSVTLLDSRRRWLGYTALLIFVLVFVPNPLQLVHP